MRVCRVDRLHLRSKAPPPRHRKPAWAARLAAADLTLGGHAALGMDRETALKRDFRVSRARRVKVERHYLRAGYRLIIPRKAEITATGHFLLFRLRPPKRSDHHGFWARWDNTVVKGRPGPAVKIELDHPSARERLAFKRSQKEYAGHWPVHDRDTDLFHVSLADRGTSVFRGVLSAGLVWGVDFSVVRPGEIRFEILQEGRKIAELPLHALEAPIIKFLEVQKRERRKGRSRRAARRLALRAALRGGLIPASAFKFFPPDTLDPRGPKEK